MEIFNKNKEKHKRRVLREKSTECEDILWQRLRNRQIDGLKFGRQFSINAFVVDFYCAEYRLAVEVDGSIHQIEGAKESDEERQRILEELGIRFVRISNHEIKNEIELVLAKILNACKPLL